MPTNQEYKPRHILAIIPARAGSTRIPGKNLQKVGPIPLVLSALSVAVECDQINEIVVSTDYSRIVDAIDIFCGVRHIKSEIRVVEQPPPMSEGKVNAVHVALWWLDQIPPKSWPQYTILLLPTSPLRSIRTTSEAIDLCVRDDCDSVVGVARSKPTVSLRTISGRYLKPVVSITGSEQCSDYEDLYAVNGAFFMARTSKLMEYRTFHMEKSVPHVFPYEESIDIDTLDDLDSARRIYKGLQV